MGEGKCNEKFLHHISEVKDGSHYAEDALLLRGGEAHGVHGRSGDLEFLSLGPALDGEHLGLVEVVIGLCSTDLELTLLLRGETGANLVKDMEIAVSGTQVDQAGLLQQVGLDLGSNNMTLLTEMNFHELAEAAGVVISQGPGISKGCNERKMRC